MDQTNQTPPHRPNPRRRKRDPKRIFMEAYLPVIIAAGIMLLIVALIVTSCAQRQQEDARKASLAALEDGDRQSAQAAKAAD